MTPFKVVHLLLSECFQNTCQQLFYYLVVMFSALIQYASIGFTVFLEFAVCFFTQLQKTLSHCLLHMSSILILQLHICKSFQYIFTSLMLSFLFIFSIIFGSLCSTVSIFFCPVFELTNSLFNYVFSTIIPNYCLRIFICFYLLFSVLCHNSKKFSMCYFTIICHVLLSE